MAERRTSLTMDILAKVRGAQEVTRLARAIDDTGDEMRGAARDAVVLERAIDQVTDEIRDLNKEFLRTGDIDVFQKIKVDRSTLGQLRKMRAELGDLGDDVEVVGRNMVRSVGDALGAIPPKLRGALILGLVTGVAAAAPLLGAVLGAAVIGSVGTGGIIGGIVSASRDQRVKTAARDLADTLSGPFDDIGEAFILPVRDSLNELARGGRDLLSDIGPDLRALAPVVVDLAEGFADAARAAGPGISDALRAAQPILRELATQLPELAEAFGDMLSLISDESDSAVVGLRTILGLTSGILRATGELVAFLSRTFAGFVEGVRLIGELGNELPVVGGKYEKLRQAAVRLQGAVTDSGEAGLVATDQVAGGFQLVTDEVSGANAVLLRHRDILRAQTDPMFALIDAQIDLRDRQAEYNQTVKDFGASSPQAQAALLALTKSAIGMESAAGAAAGTVDGKLTPAFRATLLAAGLTAPQIKAVEDRFAAARREGEKFDRKYAANITVTTSYRTLGTPPPFGLGALPHGSINVAFQHGGQVRGPAGVDRVPAALTAGEFVVNRRDALANLDLLKAINAGAAGGITPMSSLALGGDGASAGGAQHIIFDFRGVRGNRHLEQFVEDFRAAVRTKPGFRAEVRAA